MYRKLYTLLAAIVTIVTFGTDLFAQAGSPLPIGPTNVGREFYFSFPANWDYSASYKYCRLYITSNVVTTVNVWAGPTLVKTVQTKANDIVTVDLTPIQAQIFVRDDRAPIQDDQIYQNKAIRVLADDPIVVYGINRIQFTSDGFLALPTNGIGREYIVASAPDITGAPQKLPSQYMVIAPHDSTEVTIVNSWDTPNHKAGESFTITMNAGDVFSAMSKDGSGGDLTGTLISASKPVGVTSGQNCTYLPTFQYPACDHLSEMMLPISSWGKLYHSVSFAGRIKGDMYRIFAGENNASIFVNGTKLAELPKKGGAEGVGWVQFLPPDPGLYEFTSNKLIYVAQYNNSQTYDNATQTDPFLLVLTPVEQYQKELVFSTPLDDYASNFVNIVSDSTDYYNIEIAKGGSDIWQKLSMAKPATVKRFTTQVNGKSQVGAKFMIEPGSYRLRGPSAFAGYLYGFNNFDSYGYPLAAAVADLSKPDDQPPTLTRTKPTTSTVDIVARDLPEDPSMRTNLSTVTLDRTQSDNISLEVTDLDPGVSQSAKFSLRAIDPEKPARAVVAVTDMRGNVTRDTITLATSVDGTPVIEVTDIDFAAWPTGAGPTEKSITIRNTSTNGGTLNVTDISRQFAAGGPFTIGPVPALPFTLAPGESHTIKIVFDPETVGSFIDSLVFSHDAPPGGTNDAVAMVTGRGISASAYATSYDWKERPVGSGPYPGTITIANTGSQNLTLEGIQKKEGDVSDFRLPDDPAVLVTLQAGETKVIPVEFTPTAAGPRKLTVTFAHSASSEFELVSVLEGVGFVLAGAEAVEASTGLAVTSIVPNPANGDAVTLRYRIATSGPVSLLLLGTDGRTFSTNVRQRVMEPGEHTITLDLSAIPAGRYVVRLESGGMFTTHPLVVVR